MSIIGFAKAAPVQAETFQFQDLSGNSATETVSTTLLGGVIVRAVGAGTPEGDEILDIKLDGVSILLMTNLDPTEQTVYAHIQVAGDLTVEYIAGGAGNTSEQWTVTVSQTEVSDLLTSRGVFGAVINARLWDRYFGADTGLKASALASIQSQGYAELDGGAALPAWAADKADVYESVGGIIQRETAYTVDTVLKASIEAGQLQQAKTEKLAELEAWWTGQTIVINEPATEKATSAVLTSFELAIYELQRSVNQLQLVEWKAAGSTGPLTLVDHQYYSVIIADTDVAAVETAFRTDYATYGTHWDVTKQAILAATTVAALEAIEVLPV